MNKISSWPQAVVVVAAIAAAAGLVISLSSQGVALEAIVGAIVTVAAIFGGQYVAVRKASSVEAKTDDQTEKLDRIVEQTNGLSTAERQDIAERAAAAIMRRRP